MALAAAASVAFAQKPKAKPAARPAAASKPALSLKEQGEKAVRAYDREAIASVISRWKTSAGAS